MAFLKNIPSSASDAQLLELFKTSGNMQLLAELFQRYMDMCYGVCLKYLEDPEISKDAVMDVFEGLSDKLSRHEVINFRSWLYTVVKNHCLMQIRASSGKKIIRLEEEFMQTEEKMHPEDLQEKEWQLDKLSRCIENLSRDQQQSVNLFYLQQKCYKEIVEITGIEWNKVRSLIQNARRNLKICMEQEEAGIVANTANSKKNG